MFYIECVLYMAIGYIECVLYMAIGYVECVLYMAIGGIIIDRCIYCVIYRMCYL